MRSKQEELQPRALAIREPGLIAYLVNTFEALWERAEPLAVDAHPHRTDKLTDAVQRTILELMVRGQTDSAIPKRVGLSVRTVSTYIKRASEFFDCRSRAELGYRLAKSGTLDLD
ncbi:LuxR C-terminal-related transcriptional regulator [Streptomyces regalis]|uniref:LuxR C-terminal-related transcriptional regulator n=1 Tax=Streptomyces regalis TaxID=68262 RepID=UPI00099EDBF7